ncbi:uncharacterized protein [Diabrotica undecimpunctata]|uniref:uncharacterized protein n=1 Tax=Diabrotica undecimpunctata TaxID=50387 RepID=UPI003B63C714
MRYILGVILLVCFAICYGFPEVKENKSHGLGSIYCEPCLGILTAISDLIKTNQTDDLKKFAESLCVLVSIDKCEDMMDGIVNAAELIVNDGYELIDICYISMMCNA